MCSGSTRERCSGAGRPHASVWPRYSVGDRPRPSTASGNAARRSPAMPSEVDPRLDELLLLWEELRERGEPCTPEDLCRDSPDLLPALRLRLDRLGAIDGLLGTVHG